MRNYRHEVRGNAERVKKLGQWPAYIRTATLVDRVPTEENTAAGFDAGIACALDLIPRNKQELAARMHAAPDRDTVTQAREEVRLLADDPDSETCWWLAACSLRQNGGVDLASFDRMVRHFAYMTEPVAARVHMARSAYKFMLDSIRDNDFRRRSNFPGKNELDVPFGMEVEAIQGAYLAGYRYAAAYCAKRERFFIGTYEPSLGLEDFDWSKQTGDDGLPKSGPYHGSHNFVMAANADEFSRALAQVVKYLGPPKPQP